VSQNIKRVPRPAAEDANRCARKAFLSGRRVDMGGVSSALGVNRATLYRWVGSREDLLLQVLWTLADRVLAEARASTEAVGAERVVQVVGRFLELVLDHPGMQVFLRDEGELAMRLLTRADRGFQPRLVAVVQELLEQEVAAGHLSLEADVHEVAFVVVRLIETYTYLDLLTGETPDPHRAVPILRMLLR
jgi:AcrR family transcriptional regulator